jgi:hypothetical protein
MGDPRRALPPELREALDREIDPGESLRWCGQPDPRRMWIRVLPIFAVFGSLMLALSGIATFIATSIWLEVRAVAREDQALGIGFFLTMSLLVLLGSAWCWRRPWVERHKATQTIFAVTNTRVFILQALSDGRSNLNAYEPAHPLGISRTEHNDGTGTIALNPGPQIAGEPGPRASLVLVGVREPRMVERLIRQTFDPPGVK